MSIDYYDIFLKKIGQYHMATPIYSDEQIGVWLGEAAAVVSRKYSTPWSDFDSVPEAQKYQVTLYAAIEYWWSKQSELVDIGDVHVGASGSSIGIKATTKFDRAVRMIALLTEEYDELMELTEGSGDITVGDLVRRSKQTGRLVPYAEDPAGNWMS